METYGHFHIGNHTQFALDLFDAMEGSNEIAPESVMTIDLIKRIDNIPYPLALKHCTLSQLGENVKRLTKELFKHLNLDP